MWTDELRRRTRMTGLPDLYRRGSAQFGDKVRSIRADQWTNPTPCTEWDVRALVNHLVGENLWVPPLLAGKTIAEVGSVFDGDVLGDDPVAAWEDSAAAAVAAVGAAGAMDQITHLSFGDTPGDEYTHQLFLDLAIHGWDLARGIRADDTIDPEFVEMLYADLAPQEESLRATGVFGGKVVPPEGADVQTRLLAIVGRTA
jgi:uncharacterized protein (TIGR03086 family)